MKVRMIGNLIDGRNFAYIFVARGWYERCRIDPLWESDPRL